MSEPDSPSSVDTEPSGLTAAGTAPSTSPSDAPAPAPVQPTIAIGLPLPMNMPDGSPAQVPAGADATALGEFLTTLLSSVYAGAAAQGQGTASAQANGSAGAQGMNLVNVPMALPLLPGMNPVALPFLRPGTAASSSAGSSGSTDSASAGAAGGAATPNAAANPLLAMGGVNLPVLSNPLLLNMQFFQQLLGNNAAGRDAGSAKKQGRGKKAKAADEPDELPESPGSSTNRKARKNVRERARRKELNDKHDELGTQLGTVKEERVEWRMRVRDIYEAAKRMEEDRMKAHPADTPTIDPQSAECKASVAAILGAQDPEPVDEFPPAAAAKDDDDDDVPNDTPKSRKQSAAALEMANRTAVLNGTAEVLQWFQQLIRALRFARMAFSADPISVRVWNDRQVALQLLVEIGHGLYTAGRGGKKHESKRSGDVAPLSPSKDKDPFLVRALRKNAREQMRRLEVNNAFIRLARALSLPRDHKKLHLLVKALQSLRDFSASVREELEAMHSLFFPHANITIGSDHMASSSSSSGWGAGAGGRKAKELEAPMSTDPLTLPEPPKVAGSKRGADEDKHEGEHKKRQRGAGGGAGPAPMEDPTAHSDQHMAPAGPGPAAPSQPRSKRNKGAADDFDS